MKVKVKETSEMNEEKRILARKKDAERKRISRALKGTKKRSEMTPIELAHLREIERKSQRKKRINETSAEKERIRMQDKDKKQKDRTSKKESINIRTVIRMRKHRLLQSENKKSLARNKAKEGMRVLRREGPLRDYLERKKKHVWAVKWRKFLSQNPKIKELEERKKRRTLDS